MTQDAHDRRAEQVLDEWWTDADHRETTLRQRLAAALRQTHDEAIAAEREVCAEIAAREGAWWDGRGEGTAIAAAHQIENNIRARSDERAANLAEGKR